MASTSDARESTLLPLSASDQRKVTQYVAQITRLKRRLDWRLERLVDRPLAQMEPRLLQLLRLGQPLSCGRGDYHIRIPVQAHGISWPRIPECRSNSITLTYISKAIMTSSLKLCSGVCLNAVSVQFSFCIGCNSVHTWKLYLSTVDMLTSQRFNDKDCRSQAMACSFAQVCTRYLRTNWPLMPKTSMSIWPSPQWALGLGAL